MKDLILTYKAKLAEPVGIEPLVTLRITFGVLMLFSTLRFWYLGWIDNHFVEPIFHFSYFGFEWVKVLPEFWMYAIHMLMVVTSIQIIAGFKYRIGAILFFLAFTYVELIDLTYYLNHYYFVSLLALLLVLVPAGSKYSIDALRTPSIQLDTIPRWMLLAFQIQVAIVYLYAGIAKMNSTWLFEAMPLRIWLPAKDNLPIIGVLFTYPITAYVFSWAGMIYDATIPFFLWNKRTRLFAYIAVLAFHITVGALFQIGVFPMVMTIVVWVFFSQEFHEKLLSPFKFLNHGEPNGKHPNWAALKVGLGAFITFQVIFPFRYVFYEGSRFWNEEAYRFGWRVMLVEKAGTATFYVQDGELGKRGEVVNSEFLNAHQEKQMAFQPDMILQFAHYLGEHFKAMGMDDPQVYCDSWVTMNGKPSQQLIDTKVNLMTQEDSWQQKKWVLPYVEE